MTLRILEGREGVPAEERRSVAQNRRRRHARVDWYGWTVASLMLATGAAAVTSLVSSLPR